MIRGKLMRCVLSATATATLAISWSDRALAQSRTSVLVASVADALTHAPIKNAEIVLPDIRQIARTDTLGEARLAQVPRGVHRVRARFPGYAAADVELSFETDTVGPVFFLEPAPQALDTTRVTAKRTSTRLQDFEIRRAQRIGRFLQQSDFEREGTRDFSLVAQTRFPGLRAFFGADGHMRLASTRGTCGKSLSLAEADSSSNGRGGGHSGLRSGAPIQSSCASSTPCWLQVYLDGIPVGEDADLVRTWDLAGAEYYTGSSVPVQYRISGAACGVILLWSRVN